MVAAGILIAPALQAQESKGIRQATRQAAVSMAGIGVFTPAAADPKLAAVLARSGLPDSGFRFTPSESRSAVSRAVTVAVRARSARGARTMESIAPGAIAAPSVSMAPIAYNLGVSVGWRRFAVSGDVAKADLGAQPGTRDGIDLGTGYAGKRAAPGRLRAGSDRPLAVTPAQIGEDPNYSIDVGGSYRLTRNLDVTAGVRYKTERDRLPRIADERLDSQAVYVGTAFRF